ncbi:hypothetical protein OIT44_05585 [Weissella ceti]|uniref:Integral membrane protein n=1 Tax=Weissella ceti TaxID=759620 RepID=A0ABT3E5P4_9LACO|nr:hypothetical protein [Weissella ceti]MCW0953537.1 hypothetical protein [Weissella ceti]QVK12300.1 hypothetical protein KHQ31_01230 [Weissella ceti]
MTSLTDISLFIIIAGIFGLQYVWGYLNLKFIPWILPVVILGMIAYMIFNGQFAGVKDIIFSALALLIAMGNYWSGLDARKKKQTRSSTDIEG